MFLEMAMNVPLQLKRRSMRIEERKVKVLDVQRKHIPSIIPTKIYGDIGVSHLISSSCCTLAPKIKQKLKLKQICEGLFWLF